MSSARAKRSAIVLGRRAAACRPRGRKAAMGGSNELKGPDFTQGVAKTELGDGQMLLGHADGEAVLLARRGNDLFAVGASCTHYGGPLAEGMMVGDTVRCPWHHACFNLRTGEAERAP